MKLQDFLGSSKKYSYEQIAADKDLSKQIQSRLIDLNLLEPPVDGLFGKISIASLKKFQVLTECKEPGYLAAVTAEKLIETKPGDIASKKVRLQNFVGSDLKYSYEAIASDIDLTQQIQVCLITLGLLDPPADGNFGPISTAILKQFQELTQCGEPGYLGSVTATKLIETKPQDLPKLPLKLGNDLASCIIKYMQSYNYEIFEGSRQYNIVYVEGMNATGQLNKDTPNQFNDRRLVIQILNSVPSIVGNWEATTEPGSYYTYKPMNSQGAARIKFGQYKAWRVGIHGNSEPHEALVQSAEITVYRDFNKDYSRAGDKTDTGYFGVNQHWGYDLPFNNVHNASAGCLVGRLRQGHREFMALIKQDQRYLTNKQYLFYTTVISGEDLVKKFPPK